MIAEPLLQIELCSPVQFALLGGSNCFQRAAETGVAAIADFDKHQGFAVLHDEIYFASLAVEVAGDDVKSLLLEVLKSHRFRLIAL